MDTDNLVELDVCTVCIHLIANGEFNDGTDEAERKGAGLESNWAGWRLVPGFLPEEDSRFSHLSCQGCGDTLAGDRFQAYAL